MTNKEIWVIGAKNSNADKSFRWTDDIPDVTDADIIIIDLSKFPPPPKTDTPRHFPPPVGPLDPTPREIEGRDEKWKERITDNLSDKIFSGGHVIFLLHYNSVSAFMCENGLIPYGIDIKNIPNRIICFNNKHQFAKYLEHADTSDVELFLPSPVIDKPRSIRLLGSENYKITDKSKRTLGASFVADAGDGTSGRLTLLPPCQPSKTEQALDAIISVLRGDVAELPPQWAEAISIPGVENIENEINGLDDQIKKTKSKISRLESKKNDLVKYRALLYSSGIPLEQSVKAAFIKLGFDEIDQVRSGKEDWKIELRSIHATKFGVLEVKGRNAQTPVADLRQCMAWVDDYLLQSPPICAKGIFVTNQYRWDAYPESKKERKLFAPNQIEFAKLRKICIIPTYVLFEAVKKALEGHKPDRDKIEQEIFDTNGVLDSLIMD